VHVHRLRPGDRGNRRAALTDAPKDVVRSGYDAIAQRYDDWASSIESPEGGWVAQLLAQLDAGSHVLDLGCGGGRTSARTVAESHTYTGVDISPAQIERARARIPSGRFIVGDVTALELPEASFDAIVSLFMFGHVPRAEQAPLLARMRRWSKPGGWLLATMGVGDTEDEIEADWLGAPMFFASFDAGTNRKLVADAGFEVVRERVVAHDEPGHGPVSFMWLLARAVA
jgi:ubiquinone/menaquinone biosynthesis C-methylase UbiE